MQQIVDLSICQSIYLSIYLIIIIVIIKVKWCLASHSTHSLHFWLIDFNDMSNRLGLLFAPSYIISSIPI